MSGALPDITGNLSVETFKRLGPFAVRLTPSMLLAKADGQTLQQVLPLLSATGGWSPAQASVIMNKVIQNGYQVKKYIYKDANILYRSHTHQIFSAAIVLHGCGHSELHRDSWAKAQLLLLKKH